MLGGPGCIICTSPEGLLPSISTWGIFPWKNANFKAQGINSLWAKWFTETPKIPPPTPKSSLPCQMQLQLFDQIWAYNFLVLHPWKKSCYSSASATPRTCPPNQLWLPPPACPEAARAGPNHRLGPSKLCAPRPSLLATCRPWLQWRLSLSVKHSTQIGRFAHQKGPYDMLVQKKMVCKVENRILQS